MPHSSSSNGFPLHLSPKSLICLIRLCIASRDYLSKTHLAPFFPLLSCPSMYIGLLPLALSCCCPLWLHPFGLDSFALFLVCISSYPLGLWLNANCSENLALRLQAKLDVFLVETHHPMLYFIALFIIYIVPSFF
jgi:hypothetical protein